MIKKKMILISLLSLMTLGCKNREESNSYENVSEVSDSMFTNAIHLTIEGKVFKTNAMVKMKVNNVVEVSSKLEENAISYEEFVLSNELKNNLISTDEVDISEDSVKKFDKIQQTIDLTLKIPTNRIGEHLKFARSKGILIHRIAVINEELTFEQLHNNLKNESHEEQKIIRQIENKVEKAKIQNDLKYATITFQLDEDPHIITYVVPQTKIRLDDEVNFTYKLKKSLKDSGYYLKSFTFILISLFPTLLFIGVLILCFRKAIKFIKNLNSKPK